MSDNSDDPMESFKKAFDEDNAILLARHCWNGIQRLKAKISEPAFAFRLAWRGPSPQPGSIPDMLLKAGADISTGNHWWASGF